MFASARAVYILIRAYLQPRKNEFVQENEAPLDAKRPQKSSSTMKNVITEYD
jgi:hypothetical protein